MESMQELADPCASLPGGNSHNRPRDHGRTRTGTTVIRPAAPASGGLDFSSCGDRLGRRWLPRGFENAGLRRGAATLASESDKRPSCAPRDEDSTGRLAPSMVGACHRWIDSGSQALQSSSNPKRRASRSASMRSMGRTVSFFILHRVGVTTRTMTPSYSRSSVSRSA